MSTRSERASLRGQIEGGTPTIELRVVEPPEILTRVVVDTGFEGGVRVPKGSFARWGTTITGEGPVTLADGTSYDCPFAMLTIEWLDEAREVAAYEFGDEVLVGMELLDGTTLDLRSPHLVISR